MPIIAVDGKEGSDSRGRRGKLAQILDNIALAQLIRREKSKTGTRENQALSSPTFTKNEVKKTWCEKSGDFRREQATEIPAYRKFRLAVEPKRRPIAGDNREGSTAPLSRRLFFQVALGPRLQVFDRCQDCVALLLPRNT